MADETAGGVPSKECDLVMKGGITSGVVYPSLLRELSRRYLFRSIGGTSAGAIAAAAAAAAEYGRGAAARDTGFAGLARMQAELAGLDPDTGQMTDAKFLLGLFRPNRKLGDVFQFALAVYSGLMRRANKWRKVGQAPERTALGVLPIVVAAAFRHFPARMAAALLIGIAVPLVALGLLGAGTNGAASLAGLLGGALIGAVLIATTALAAVALLGARFLAAINRDLPGNLFGVCAGRGEGSGIDRSVLTDWLYLWLNRLAGLPESEPLTFEHLANHRFAGVASPGNVGITLRMVTSNLTQRIPHLLPFDDELFIFSETEFARLFPEPVIDYLRRRERSQPLFPGVNLPDGFHFLPLGDALPVIVATRMSLSFPLLLSAVPVYSLAPNVLRELRPRAPGAAPITVASGSLQRHWLSDGGICSNFPIHFFDNWAPSHPTFGVNLSSLEANQIAARMRGGSSESGKYQASARMMPHGAAKRTTTDEVDGALVFLPRADSEPLIEFRPFERADGSPAVFEFFASLFGTASEFRDTLQAIQPGYRERIVQIRLAADEGGLNLDMNGAQLERLFKRGDWAAAKLLDEFDWEDHRWVRLRVLLGEFESRILQLYNGLPPAEQMEIPGVGSDRPYPIADDADPLGAEIDRAELRRRVASLALAIETWRIGRRPVLHDAPQRPLPDGVLRITPEF